jgi:Flp pilus assembly pilin Flp
MEHVEGLGSSKPLELCSLLSSKRILIMTMTESLRRLLTAEDGAELAEYAVGVALLVAIALVVLKVIGNAINDENNGTAARIEDASNDPGL